MFVADLKAENVAGKIERADLPTAIIKDFGGPNSAADELVKILGGHVTPTLARTFEGNGLIELI